MHTICNTCVLFNESNKKVNSYSLLYSSNDSSKKHKARLQPKEFKLVKQVILKSYALLQDLFCSWKRN